MDGVEIPKWLLGLPFAPEFRPTDTEFADPITYISKIEKEASAFGICKIIPPFPKPSKKYAISNLNKSLLRSSELSGGVNVSNLRSSSKLGSVDDDNEGEVRAVFTTRHQELGQSVKKTKGVVQNPQLGVHKQVWQSGEAYTLEQFESKSKAFARSVLSGVKEPSPLAVESLFWKAACDKPIYVEYANDVPGSAFGEPEGKFRYFHRRRRKRNYFQRSKEQSSELKSGESATLMDFHSMDSVGTSTMDNLNASPEKSKSSATTVSLDDPSHHSRGKGSNSCIEMEGSAGWKLSNSPWNLQVIARSPGSLTRFMPDDIPGVTSPMVYIGMLFSWFAWHVEDHELHSMNFLHVGSPKTWYSVPGDYAYAFEDVVRAKAYGGSVDHLAALTLLGEKTTLLSPEVVIASGIPCCRLIQNPGEFVVTFPRAYHVGFSHGFNCGEAANFGTSQWLSVAKEAAVRRAAMNYLPMLSHQQLLYLLTMSFVSRVPRSLLPGVRSSRLLSRQKEEREFLVKKSFVEDILGENNMLSILLEKEPSCRAVLWNPDMLPYLSKDSQLPNTISAVATSPTRENVYCNHSETLTSNDKNMQTTFIDEMTLNLETMNDMYLESDDLSCDFQVDSGTLACVACGILGFPFMSVVQPSEKAARELLCADHLSIDKRLGVFGHEIDHCSPHFGGTHTEDSTSVPDVNCLSKDLSEVSIPKCNKGWNKSSKFFRPRSFCLQHAVDIIELLQSKGGVNILVICHSDYHKIKANAVAISEEIGNRFVYNEVQLDVASEDDLRLIDLAVDEERGECGEDWTSRLGINLRHCVKVRKNSPTKQVQHALKLGGLFLDRTPGFNFLTINWLSKKSRSKKIYMLCKPFKSMPIKDEVAGGNSDCKIGKREEKFVQYYRRNKKSGNSTAVGSIAQPASHRDSSSIYNVKSSGSNVSELGSTDPAGMIEMRHGAVLHKTDYTNANPATSLAADYPSTLVGRISETEIGNCMSEDIDGESYNLPGDVFEVQQKIITTLDESELNKKVASNLTSPLITAIDESFEMRQEQEIMGSHHKTNEACNIVSDGQLHALTDEDAFMKDINLAKPLGSHDSIHVGNLKEEMDNAVVEKLSNEVFDGVTRGDVEQEFTSPNRVKDNVEDSCNFILAKQQHFLDFEDLSQSGHLEDGVEQEVMSTCESNTSVPILMNIRSLNLKDRTSVVSKVVCAASNICNAVTSGDVVNDLQIIDTDTETRPVSGVLVQLEVQLSHFVEDNKYLENLESQEVMADENSLEILESQEGKDHHVNTLMLSTGIQNEMPTTMPESVSNIGILGESQPMHVEVTGVASEKQKFTGGLTPDNDVECANLSTTERSSKSVSRYDMSTGGPLNPIHFETQMETCDATEICSSKYDREGENMKDLKSNPSPNLENRKKRNRDEECIFENEFISCDFIRSPCEGLRPRVGRNLADRNESDVNITVQEKPDRKKVRRPSDVSSKVKKEIRKQAHKCDLEGCRMSFETKAELALHKRNQCPHEGCGKRFSSHKYAMLHKRVHDDDRPLKCPWKGCSMSFKWAWARTEHIRVHTGERPYKCKVDGCGLSFRFVSDYSRHRRKTGHYVDQPV